MVPILAIAFIVVPLAELAVIIAVGDLIGLLPTLLAGPLAGVLVDRWDRRRTLVAVSLAQAGFLLPLLAVHGREQLWIVYLVTAVEAVLAQLNGPAFGALLPTLVGERELVAANGLVGLNGNLGRLVGSPLGGVLVEVSGLPGLVVGDALSFLVGAALVALVRTPAPARGTPTQARVGVVHEWLDGLAVTLRTGRLRWGLVVSALAAVAQGVFTVLFVLYVGLFVAASLPAVAMLSGLTALVQTETPDAYLGRVLATYLGTFNGLQAVGMLLAGLLGDALGVVQVLNGQAALYLLAGVVALLTLGRRRRIAPARTPPAGRAAATWLGGRRQARTSKPVRMPLA